MNRWGVSIVAAGLLVAVSSSTGAHATGGWDDGRLAFTFDDPNIVESSGVVASSLRDHVWFTHNDSGDSARFFAVDEQGCTLGAYDLPGVTATDIEDIARGPVTDPDDPSKTTSTIWLGDIGDNLHERSEIAVYGVAEPESNASTHRESDGCDDIVADHHDVTATTYRLQYPDVAHDAETLLADPVSGQLFIVTKAPTGESQLYSAPEHLDASTVNVLKLETEIVYPPSATYDRTPDEALADLNGNPAGAVIYGSGRLWADGGDIAADREHLVIRTYTDAWEWPIDAGQSLRDALLLHVPSQIPLQYELQGEAIGYAPDGDSFLTTTENPSGHGAAHLYTRDPG